MPVAGVKNIRAVVHAAAVPMRNKLPLVGLATTAKSDLYNTALADPTESDEMTLAPAARRRSRLLLCR